MRGRRIARISAGNAGEARGGPVSPQRDGGRMTGRTVGRSDAAVRRAKREGFQQRRLRESCEAWEEQMIKECPELRSAGLGPLHKIVLAGDHQCDTYAVT